MTALHRPIGILGGTFDPIHLGHLSMAEACLACCDLEMIYFLPCRTPVLKNAAHASNSERVTMLKLAIGDEPQFAIDERELHRATPSYTLLSLQELQLAFPATPLCFILGMDAFNRLSEWYHWQKLFAYCHFIVINRPGFTELDGARVLQDFIAERRIDDYRLLQQTCHGSVYFLELDAMLISSSDIRQAIALGLNIKAVLPGSVWEYIQEQRLYRQ